MSSVVTPHQDNDADVASSSIKRDIQRHASAADEMIQSIRNELFTPPGAAAKTFVDDGDDDELGDEINRLARVQDDIRQEVIGVHNVGSFFMDKRSPETLEKTTVEVTREERNGLIFFVLVGFWIVVYIKQWIELNMPGSRI
jgi:hypothetical protein